MKQTYKVTLIGNCDGVVKATKEIIEDDLRYWNETDEWKEDYKKRAKQFEDLVNNGAEVKTLEEFFAVLSLANEWNECMCCVDYNAKDKEIIIEVTW